MNITKKLLTKKVFFNIKYFLKCKIYILSRMSVSSSVSASTSTSNTLTAFVVGVAVGAAFSSSVSNIQNQSQKVKKRDMGLTFMIIMAQN